MLLRYNKQQVSKVIWQEAASPSCHPAWQQIYFAFVHEYILYGLEVYGNTFPSYLDKLTVLNNNNKLLRILQKKGRTCCKESLYLQYPASCTVV